MSAGARVCSTRLPHCCRGTFWAGGALRRRRRRAGTPTPPGSWRCLAPSSHPPTLKGGEGTKGDRATPPHCRAVRSSLCPRAYRRGGIAPRHKTTLLCNSARGIDTKAGVLCSSGAWRRRPAAPFWGTRGHYAPPPGAVLIGIHAPAPGFRARAGRCCHRCADPKRG